jgi:hypothetical protein
MEVPENSTADECCIIFAWQTDAYQETGCYNLHCSGFVQTNNRIAIGAAISPTSVYNGRQFDISLLIWKVYIIIYICAPHIVHGFSR